MYKTLLVVLFLLVVVTLGAKVDYSDYQLLRVKLENDGDLKQLLSLLRKRADLIDVWSHEGQFVIGSHNDIMLHKRDASRLLSVMKQQGNNKVQVLSHSIQELINKERANATIGNEDYFADYRDYEQTMAYLKDIQKKHSNVASLFTLGTSWEGRQIVALKISTNKQAGKPRPTVFFNSMQHAREWIGVPVTVYALTQLLENQKDPKIANLLNKIDIVFVPIVNPDGFHYTHTTDRLWRKNRRDNGNGSFGVDLNRNWPTGFGVGASNNTDSLIYNGPYPLSEPETASVFNYLRSFLGNIKAGIDFHSYSQLILRPYGYKNQPSADEDKLKALGAEMQSAIASVTKEPYQNIRSIELYPAGGTLDDDFYASQKMAGYTIELRDTGTYGFILPVDQIKPTITENYQAILVMCNWVANGGSVKGF
jgi:murein tripeptide amidase MpaA